MAPRRDGTSDGRIVQKPWEDNDLDTTLSAKGWAIHRETMMAEASPGTRPYEWWLYEQHMEPPQDDTWFLRRNGHLSDAEKSHVESWWRATYNRGVESETSHLRFPRIMGKNRDKRENSYGWKDILPELIERWDADHERNAETVRALIDGRAAGQAVKE